MSKVIAAAGAIVVAACVVGWIFLESASKHSGERGIAAAPGPAAAGPSEPDEVEPDALQQPSEAPVEVRAFRTDEARVAAEAVRSEGQFEIVLEGPDGPVAGARVLVFRDAGSSDLDHYGDIDRVDAWMEEHGRELSADAAGKVHVAPPGDRAVLLVATAPGLWGRAKLDADDESPFPVQLGRDATLRARVVSTRNEALEGVPVGLRRKTSYWSYMSRRQATDALGAAVFRHAQRSLPARDEGSWALAIEAVLPRPVERTLDPEALPEEVVTLVMPATGTVVVQVREDDGSAAIGAVSLGIVGEGQPRDISPFGSERREYVETQIRDGVARFEHVALGQELEVKASRPQSRVATRVFGFGPAVQGEVREFDVLLGQDHPVLLLRAVDVEGTPFARTKLELRLRHESKQMENSNEVTVTTDDEGLFRFDLDAGWSEGSTRTLTVALADTAGEDRSASLDLSEALPPGTSNRGDVVLAEAPIFARGRVVSETGQPIPGASLVLRRKTGNSWNFEWNFHHEAGQDGSFELSQRPVGDAFELGASKNGWAGPLVPFAPGVEGLEIVMRSEGAIAGQLLLDEIVPRDKLTVLLQEASGGLEHLRYNERQADPDEDGSFRIGGLLPGTYTANVRLDGSSDLLATVDGIVVTSGSTAEDPRLAPLDLRGQLFTHRLTLLLPDGAERVQGEIHFGPAGSEELDSQTWFHERELELVTRFEPIDMVVQARGYRAARHEGVRGEIEVRLRGGLPVRIRLGGNAQLPAPPVFVKAVLASADGGHVGIDWGAPAFDESREIVVKAPAPGKMKVFWIVEHRTSGSSMASSKDVEPEQTVEILDLDTEQTIDVTLTEEQMAKLLDGL